MDILIKIQEQLKVPKKKTNSFGKYKYRSCEDILEAAKPVLFRNDCCVVIHDDVVCVGGNVYVKSTAELLYKNAPISKSTGFAREAVTKKGMDDSQITGTASSYARKYALNGLFCIDDTDDADTMDNREPEPKKTEVLNKKIVELAIERFTACETMQELDAKLAEINKATVKENQVTKVAIDTHYTNRKKALEG